LVVCQSSKIGFTVVLNSFALVLSVEAFRALKDVYSAIFRLQSF
jgi:hypothetical protein